MADLLADDRSRTAPHGDPLRVGVRWGCPRDSDWCNGWTCVENGQACPNADRAAVLLNERMPARPGFFNTEPESVGGTLSQADVDHVFVRAFGLRELADEDSGGGACA
jgi:hypothetical protein